MGECACWCMCVYVCVCLCIFVYVVYVCVCFIFCVCPWCALSFFRYIFSKKKKTSMTEGILMVRSFKGVPLEPLDDGCTSSLSEGKLVTNLVLSEID